MQCGAPLTPQETRFGTRDGLVLGALCLLAFYLRVHFALIWNLGYDETWHIFKAGVEPFSFVLVELRSEAHPPLSHFLLRWLTPLDGLPLWPRMVSIVPSLATMLLVFFCALEFGIARPIAYLAVLMLAVSTVDINIAACVRSYSLSTMLTLTAYFCLLRILRDPVQRNGHAVGGFLGAALLAMWTTYCAAFVVGAALVVLALEGLRDPAFLPALWRGRGTHRRWPELLILAVGAAAATVYVRSTHGRWTVGHVSDLFPLPGESTARFAWRGLVGTLDLFSPLPMAGQVWSVLVVGAYLASLAWLVARYLAPASPHRDPQRGSALLIQLLLWVIILALATHRLYPLGGRMRHQFVFFPFLLFLVLFLLDEVYRRLRNQLARNLLCLSVGGTAVAVAVAALGGPPIEEFSNPPLWQIEVAAVRHAMREGDALYLGQYNAIGVFGNMRDWRWRHRRRSEDGVDLFTVQKGAARLDVLRDTQVWTVASPPDPPFLARLADLMRRYQLAAVWVFALPQPPYVERTGDQPDETTRRSRFREHGLTLEQRIVFERGEAFRATLEE